MSTYTPPTGDAVNFSFEGSYTAPNGDNVNFAFGLIAEVVSDFSISDVYDADGFDQLVVRWTSDIDGTYRLELGGSGVNTGDLLTSGSCIADWEVENIIAMSDITTASGYAGSGSYRFNIYVRSTDGIWTFYE